VVLAIAEGPMIAVQAQAEPRDYVHFRFSRFYGRGLIRLLLAVSLLAVLGCALAALQADEPRTRVALIGAAALLLGYWLVITPVALYFAATGAYGANRALRQSLRFGFSTEGVSVSGPLASAHQSWSVYRGVQETRRAFHLYAAGNVTQLVPKRCFASAEDVQHFREVVRAALGERARGLRG
jgi:hypothetical protein